MTFDDSRRLTGPNMHFAACGAVLEVLGADVLTPALEHAWRANVAWACAALRWPAGDVVVRRHASGAELALAAREDQLFTATEVNEWAWTHAAGEALLHAPAHPASWDRDSALWTLHAASAAERHPRLLALRDAAAASAHVPLLLFDDDTVSLGTGAACATWPFDALPAVDDVAWDTLRNMPIALVTGSNGKTTCVRLLAACIRAAGLRSGHSCTDGLYVDGQAIDAGDYSGPAGARAVLRHADVQAAVLECARGGLLRRGLALRRADVALVTNISPDHYGEFGIHCLDDLADAKLVLARAIDGDGLLVLNADDPLLLRKGAALACPRGWFALDADAPALRQARARNEPTCGVRGGRVVLTWHGAERDLGAIDAMPLTLAGRARYNVANVLAAALTAAALRIAPAAIAAVLAAFGAQPTDNPGRLQRRAFGGVEVYVDYAHNPEGLQGLLDAALAATVRGRLALLLGQAGNREDADIRALADVAARSRPALIVLKDVMLRGRAPGEVPAILADALRRGGIDDARMQVVLDEVDAVRALLRWARDGDVLVLPVHASAAQREVGALLDALEAGGWEAGRDLVA